MRKKLGVLCMIIGGVLFLSAMALLIFNNTQSLNAEKACEKVVSQLKGSVSDTEIQAENSKDSSDSNKKTKQMSETLIDDNSYIGYLSIPSQGLELPVMSQWDYQSLRIAPCRYSGTVDENNFVIIAHNYSSHFGNLDELNPKDEVRFTDVTGDLVAYTVACVDVVPPSSTKEVTSGDSDLALVTCTYSGKTRFVVYCDKVQK